MSEADASASGLVRPLIVRVRRRDAEQNSGASWRVPRSSVLTANRTAKFAVPNTNQFGTGKLHETLINDL